MNIVDGSRQKELFNILFSIKMASLLFCTILFLNQYYTKHRIGNLAGDIYISVKMSMLFIVLITIVFLLWYFFSVKIYETRHFRKMFLIENIVFIALYIILFIISNTYESQYKLLFIFVIITSTLQLGMKFGLTVAGIISSLILIIDLMLAPKSIVNSYFEKDLILIGVFISTAAVLGHYVRFENEQLNQKNIDLQTLSKEIKEKDLYRKHLEQILFNNETCYNLLFQNSNDAIIVHRNKNIIYANGSALLLLAINSPSELMEKSFLEFSLDSDRKDLEARLLKLSLDTSSTMNFEQKILNSDGAVVIVQNTSTIFIYEGKPTILSILHDITSDRQVEKLQKDVQKNIELINETMEFNKSMTEFFSNISHELKTPLNVIYSALQVLLLNRNISERTFIESQDKYLKVMKQNCFRLMRLINNILDLTKLDSGFLRLNLENHNIVSIVEDISLSVVSYLESRGITLIFDTDIEEAFIAVDPDKIERIILNLLSNACKFTGPGGYIYVTIVDRVESISISVKDTGIGIPNDKLEIIFERFEQVDKTFKRFHEGTGIGLSLVKSFTEMHNGSVEIKSEEGIGSEFIVNIPKVVLSENSSESMRKYENNIERINIEFSDIYSGS